MKLGAFREPEEDPISQTLPKTRKRKDPAVPPGCVENCDLEQTVTWGFELR